MTLGQIGTHILYIRGDVKDIKDRQSAQDELIRNLQNNCNREERWEMIREDVKELKASMGDIIKRMEMIEKALENHTVSQSTVSRLFKEYRDLLWAAVVVVISAYLAWRWK